jgi:hypothetical protein
MRTRLSALILPNSEYKIYVDLEPAHAAVSGAYNNPSLLFGLLVLLLLLVSLLLGLLVVWEQ